MIDRSVFKCYFLQVLFDIMPAKTKLNKKDFKKILEDYDIGKYKSHKHIWWALQNTVYEIITAKERFVIKVFEGSRHAIDRKQLKIMLFAEKHGVPVPSVMIDKKGKRIGTYKNKKSIIQKFVKGTRPGKLNEKMTKSLANTIGKMNKALMKIDFPVGEPWGKDFQFKHPNFKIKKAGKFNIQKEADKLLIHVRKLKRSNMRKSVIHNDICESNVIFRNNKVVAIIDWGDSQKNYIAEEIAIIIAHYFTSKKNIRRKKIRLFLKEYQKHIKLTEEEKKAIYYFVKFRLLSSISWCLEMSGYHDEKRKEIYQWGMSQVEYYKTFDKIQLEEFLEMIK